MNWSRACHPTADYDQFTGKKRTFTHSQPAGEPKRCMMGYLAPVSDHRMLTTFRGELWDTFSAPYSIVPYPTKWRGHYIGLGRDFGHNLNHLISMW